MLVPSNDAFVATFYDTEARTPPEFEIYVDIATPALWSEERVSSTDLDLDVIKDPSGRTFVEDEDEFAKHQVSWGYPPELVDLAVRSCAEVLAAMRACRPPYDGTHLAWLEMLAVRVDGERSSSVDGP